MGLFKKKDAPAIADAMAQVRRAQEIAAQGAAQVEQQTGMSVQAIQADHDAMMQSGQMQKMQAYAARSARLYQAGIDTPALLRGAQFGQHSPMLGGIPAQVQVTVQPLGAAPYEVDTDQVVSETIVAALVPGQQVTVRVDPADPRSLMIWGVGSAPATAPTATAAPADPSAQLAKLQALHASGVLTDVEFAEQSAKLSSQA